MSPERPRPFWLTLWRGVRVALGAFAFAVVGSMLVAVASLLVGGSEWPLEYTRYAAVALFALGIPVMLRWLK
jgi:hypothetical protein